jgi:hypothetical protein
MAPSLNKILVGRTNDIQQHLIRWHREFPQILKPNMLANLVYTQLLLPFSTVMCFFADDFQSTRDVAKTLASWLITLSTHPLALPHSIYPRILVLQEWTDPAATFDEKLATNAFKREIREETDLRNDSFVQRGHKKLTDLEVKLRLKQLFSYIGILPLPTHSSSAKRSQRQLHKLRSRILQESQEVQILRGMEKLAFSAVHFLSLFHSACCHFATDCIKPFSFIKASRQSNPVPKGFDSHIGRFLKLVPREHRLKFAVPVIASAMALDSYPPGAHSR